MAETDLSDLLPHITVPTLSIWGQGDARSPLIVARQFEEAIPDSTLVVIERAGHLRNLERPERGERRRARILSCPPAGFGLGEPATIPTSLPGTAADTVNATRPCAPARCARPRTAA
jgi:hypothetical protein